MHEDVGVFEQRVASSTVVSNSSYASGMSRICMRSPTCRQNQNQANFSDSLMRRQPKRSFQRIGSKMKADNVYR